MRELIDWLRYLAHELSNPELDWIWDTFFLTMWLITCVGVLLGGEFL